jgi:transcriptional regulator with XRE-family HTH domain
MIVKEFLDKCKEKLNISSSYALAKEWGVSETILSNYYNGKRSPDEFACFKIAETLNLDPAFVIAQIRAENEKDEKKAEYFRVFGGVLKRQAVNILLVLVCVGSLVSAPDTQNDNLLIAIASSCATALFLRLRRFV